jgi:hypothetical protein
MLRIAIPFALATPLVGCGDETTTEHTVNEAGCEHMKDGAIVSVTASANQASPATPPAFDHKRLDVALADLSPSGKGGYVAFNADEATEFIFFLSNDIPFEILDSSDTTVVPDDDPAANPECASLIPTMVAVDLEVGAYKLFFGGASTTATTVGLVYEEAGAHHHD